MTALQQQLASDNATIASLQSQLAGTGSSGSTITSLQQQLASDNATISSLQSQLATAKSAASSAAAQVTSLQAQVQSDATNLSSLEQQIQANTADINSLQIQVSTLEQILATYEFTIVSATQSGSSLAVQIQNNWAKAENGSLEGNILNAISQAASTFSEEFSTAASGSTGVTISLSSLARGTYVVSMFVATPSGGSGSAPFAKVVTI